MAKKLRIQQLRGLSGHPDRHRRTMEALGLHRIRHTVEHGDTPQIRGMVEQVKHLVSVEEVNA